MARASICVGVPVWRGVAFVAETLESIRRQRDVRFVAVISVDGDDAESAIACRPFLADPRFRLVVQKSRLGWVGNTAAVLAAAIAEGPEYACVQPHDDLLEDDYLASLLETADKSPSAAAVFCDIAPFGNQLKNILSQQTVAGAPVDRLRTLLLEHFNAVAYRALTRTSMLARLAPISGNPLQDFAVDTVWMTRLATAGDLVRVPRALYRKRYHAGNTHSAWSTWPDERKIAAWMRHCLDMFAEAVSVAKNNLARRELLDAARDRLVQTGRKIGPYQSAIAALSEAERQALLHEFNMAAEPLLADAERRETLHIV